MQTECNMSRQWCEDQSCRTTKFHLSSQESPSPVHLYVSQYTERPDHASETTNQKKERNSLECHYRTGRILEK